MVEIDGIAKCYGKTKVFQNLSLKIEEPGIYCLLSRNGAGKTTLMKAIAGYLDVSEGSISIDGKRISKASMTTDVSYIENYAKHFNLPIGRLLKIAANVNEKYDEEAAKRMLERFELDSRKKYNQLSLGMKSMGSTIISLASCRSVILLDEPVLGFDVIMREEFYNMLEESFRDYPRTIIISTHIIEEIAKAVNGLIVLDEGRIKFFDTLQSVESKAYSVSGLRKDVEEATAGLRKIGEQDVGGLLSAYIFDNPPSPSEKLEIRKLSLQEFFIQLVRHKGGRK